MPSTDLRPAVADVAFAVFARPPHPELLPPAAAAGRRNRDGCAVELRLAVDGHTAVVRTAAGCLVEWLGVAAGRDGAVAERRLRGEQRVRHATAGGLVLQASAQVEVLSPELFAAAHDELLMDGLRRGLLHRFGPAHRVRLAPLGWIDAEFLPSGVLVTAAHTFPDERSVVRTRTLIE